MTRTMKFVFGSGVLSVGLLALTCLMAGCSGGDPPAPASLDETKINGMSLGEYRDSVETPISPKGAKKARTKQK